MVAPEDAAQLITGFALDYVAPVGAYAEAVGPG